MQHYGARSLKRAIQRYVQNPLAEMILAADGGDLTFNGRKPEFVDEDEFDRA